MVIHFLENGLSTESIIEKIAIQTLTAVAQAECECILKWANGGRIAAMAFGIQYGRKSHA